LPLFAEKIPNGNVGFKSFPIFSQAFGYTVILLENAFKPFVRRGLKQVSLICVIAKWRLVSVF